MSENAPEGAPNQPQNQPNQPDNQPMQPDTSAESAGADPQGSGPTDEGGKPESESGRPPKLEDLLADVDEHARTAVLDQVSKARREAAGYRKQVRELEPLAAKAKEVEEAKLSVEEKAAKKAREAEERYTALTAELLRERAARRHNIPDELVDFLTGADEDSLEDQAKRLADLTRKPQPSIPRKPKDGANQTNPDQRVPTPDELFKRKH